MTEQHNSIDFRKLTPAQRRVLGSIAINDDGGHPQSTLNALLAKGLIEKYSEPSQFGPLRFHIYRYLVPLHVHIQWCEYCSTLPDSEVSQ